MRTVINYLPNWLHSYFDRSFLPGGNVSKIFQKKKAVMFKIYSSFSFQGTYATNVNVPLQSTQWELKKACLALPPP